MGDQRTDRTSGGVRFSLSQMFGMFTTLAIIIGAFVIAYNAQDVRVTVLAIVCLVLFSWIKISRPAT
jgi:hypothetical protein